MLLEGGGVILPGPSRSPKITKNVFFYFLEVQELKKI